MTVAVAVICYQFIVMEHPVFWEPIALSAAVPITISRVQQGARDPAPPRFVHAHAAVELVLFERVSGVVITDEAAYALKSGSAIWAPAMMMHDFRLDAGAAAWTLVQYHPHFSHVDLGRCAFGVTLAPDDLARALMIADWLGAAERAGRGDEALRLLELLELIISRSMRQNTVAHPAPQAFTTLRPVLEHIRATPSAQLSLSAAGRLCGLSPSYFSRLFRKTFGHGFSDYLNQYRLKTAAVLLASTDDPIKVISYRAGFRHHAYFTAQFRKVYGQTPTAFRQRRKHDGRIGLVEGCQYTD